MILVLKKKTLVIIIIIVLFSCLLIGVGISYAQAFVPDKPYVVVLDAGHGGRDNGVTGVQSKTSEKEVNLAITFLVQDYLEKANIKVILTRKDDNALYGDVKRNFKIADMAKRKEIINQAKPNVVVSIHCNKFPTDSNRRGAQVFYEPMSKQSKDLADALQASLNILNEEYSKRQYTALKGDYYILKCSKYASAIVEAGFMSNPEEDILLQDKEYRIRIAYKIASGIIGYLSLNNSVNGVQS